MTTLARLTDRVRPWRAPPAPAGAPKVAVIGAGPAGLATAALLRRRGIDAVVIDRRHDVGGSWPTRYDSLRLNTVRWMSDLPGLRMPRSLGRWVGRDDIVEYLRTYADHHALTRRLGVEVTGIRREDGTADGRDHGWEVDVDGHRERFGGVVVATGHSARPVLSDWSGACSGRVMHASAYRRPDDHSGRRVLVVGAGSSGGEICVDLARAGVDVVWSVRSAPQVFPREIRGIPSTPFAPLGDALPDPLLDRVAPGVERLVYGRRDYLPEPPAPMTQLLARCKEPMTADGIVELIRAGTVTVVAAVDDLVADGARLVDGTVVDADDVIAATGYRPGLDTLVGHLDVLDGSGRPTAVSPLPGLAFVGFRVPITGTLWALETDARRAARTLLRS